MGSATRWALTAALSTGVLAAAERPARADAATDVAIIVAVAAIAADVTFFAYDVKVAAEGQLPARGWSIAETAVGVPQTILANGAFIALANEGDKPAVTAVLIIPAALTSMTVHGVWSTATTHVRPGALFGYSPLIGTNIALTAAAVGRAAKGRWGTRVHGIVETVLTAPQVALGVAQMFHDPQNRNIWIGHTAWTGALLLHGIASIAAGRSEDDSPPPVPPPPPPPLDEQERERPPLKVPYPSFSVVPGVVTDGVARAPGVVMVGAF